MSNQRFSPGNKPALLVILALATLACGGISNPLNSSGPLDGLWKEVAQVECDAGQEITPPEPILELVLRSGRDYSVTWHPFESYRDYWGTYTYDAKTGALTLEIDNGNYEPSDADLEGTATIDSDGRLVLTDMWLGSPPGGRYQPTPTSPTDRGIEPEPIVQICGQVFTKRN